MNCEKSYGFFLCVMLSVKYKFGGRNFSLHSVVI